MRTLTFPLVAALTIPLLAALLLIIGARSPYTHSNLTSWFGLEYDRTPLSLVGQLAPFRGAGLTPEKARDADPAVRGGALYVSRGCASCHGLQGQGGAVGPAIAGTDAETLRKKTQKGPGGMPAFSPQDLTDEDLAAMAAYLHAVSATR